MEAMQFETFIRRAFGLKEGQMLERWGDPAALANTDQFSEGNISAVKVGIGYSFEILSTEIFNKVEDIDDSEYKRIEQFTDRVVAAENLKQISEIIKEYVNTVEEKYFQSNDGVMTLK